MSQNERLKTYLRSAKTITQLRATTALGVLRLSERIRELEAMGWVFLKTWHYPKGKSKYYLYTTIKEGK